MSDLLFDTAGLSSIETDAFDATYQALRQRHHIEVPGYIDFQLEQFEALNHHRAVNIRDTYAIKNPCGDSYLLFIDTHTEHTPVKGRKTYFTEYQPWALAYLKRDFGRVFIRTETIIDKIREIIFPIELDFKEDKPFSDRFYVLTDDKHKTEQAMVQQFRDAMMAIKETDFVVEIFEHTLIIGNRKPISPENALYLADFVARLAELKC
ncbi:hypothetical protein [Mucilaginibacter phyllosphaerae]|uniref:Uncharacterized protein n=1 Tax=Mucilaginibacter phyllosphaerae TaxID=1812349 RepID=A0A4Y8A8A2_9SPHI|nr:hypothetical protein [Mucilaginibacter phyllosphaerae]MBB3970603.1 hypothetical protein [Mucilaginibacter phyllosphaerae]TEW64610.1 hypothetical protein E2R65_16470 [Mucilaginibacter phyllosphaerae]GGH19798.1 hypothetical protein GCM10007352_31360 [Mucilaginibacter phyllosphaerae]